MASRQARQERQLERQRGAGRQVRDVGPQLILPAGDASALQPIKSTGSRRTPHRASLQPQTSSRRTPAAGRSARSVSRKTPTSHAARPPSSARTPAAQNADGKRPRGRPSLSSSRKRPRLDSEVAASTGAQEDVELDGDDEDDETAPVESEAPADQTSTKKRKKRKSIGQRPRRYSKPNPVLSIEQSQPTSARRRGRPKSLNSIPSAATLHDDIQQQLREEISDVDDLDEVGDEIIMPTVEPTQGTGHTPYKKQRRKRKSIGQQSRRKTREHVDEIKEEPGEQAPVAMADIPEEEEDNEAGMEEVIDQIEADEEQEDEALESEEDDLQRDEPRKTQLQTLPKIRRKKRKSIGQQRPKRLSVSGARPTALPRSRASGGKTSNGHARPAKTQSRQTRRSPSPPNSSDVGPASTKRSRGRPAKASPQNPQSRAHPSSSRRPSPRASAPRKVPANAIPITVYRDVIHTPSDSEDENYRADPIHLLHSSKPRTFNSVDVLAQITHERLSNFAQNINDQPSASQTERKALQLYAKEMEVRLRRLSRALDRSKGLGIMVKRLAKEERVLKEQVKEIEVRRKELETQRRELEGKKRDHELGALLGRIGQVAKKGWALERARLAGSDD